MVKIKILLLSVFLIIPVAFVCAQNSNAGETAAQETKSGKSNVKVGPGMGVIKYGGLNIVAPEDIQVRKEGGRVVAEDRGAYIGRKFDEIAKRLNNIELKQDELKKELEQLKRRTQNLENNNNSSNNNVKKREEK